MNPLIQTADFISKLQKKMVKEIGGQKKSKKMGLEQQKPFLICLVGQCSNHKKSKIYDCLEYLDCRAIDLAQYQYQINPDFLDLSSNVA